MRSTRTINYYVCTSICHFGIDVSCNLMPDNETFIAPQEFILMTYQYYSNVQLLIY